MPVKSLPKLTKLSGFQTLKMTNLQKWNAPVLLEASRFYIYLLLGGLVSTACLISLTELQPFQGWVTDFCSA
jgi:hypothetical protein